MIDHIIHFYHKDFSHTWLLQLPYRLIRGDLVHAELLEKWGELQFSKKIASQFYELEFDDYLIVGKLEINHNAYVVAWLNIPEE